jgi:hypothetical protein
MEDVAVLTLADRARWEEWESGGALPSQCWRFAKPLTESGFLPRLALVSAGGSRMVLPYSERVWGQHRDIATLPGLSGASIVPPSEAPLAQWRAFAAMQGWVSGYIQLSPASHPNVPPDARPVNQTHAFLLDSTNWNLRRSASPIIRRKVDAGLRNGAVIVTDRERLTDRLLQLYPETLSWFGAPQVLSEATIAQWAHDPQNLILGVAIGGDIEIVHLLHVHGAAAEFHLAGSSVRGRSLSALLYVSAIEQLRDHGVTRFNLGGGGTPNGGLSMFKRWLGARPVPMQSIRQIYDPERYADLCAQAGPPGDLRWFPAYRAPRGAHPNG